jgi:hypothetical protein
MTRAGNLRYDARRDDTEPSIVEALQKAGWHVWRKLPVDLLAWHPVHGYRCLEAKSEGKPLKPKDGPQKEFVEITGCPIVNDPEKALEVLRDSGAR